MRMSITRTVEFRAAVTIMLPEHATDVTSPPQSVIMLTVNPESRSQHLQRRVILRNLSTFQQNKVRYLMLPSLLPLQTNDPLPSSEHTQVTAASWPVICLTCKRSENRHGKAKCMRRHLSLGGYIPLTNHAIVTSTDNTAPSIPTDDAVYVMLMAFKQCRWLKLYRALRRSLSILKVRVPHPETQLKCKISW